MLPTFDAPVIGDTASCMTEARPEAADEMTLVVCAFWLSTSAMIATVKMPVRSAVIATTGCIQIPPKMPATLPSNPTAPVASLTAPPALVGAAPLVPLAPVT